MEDEPYLASSPIGATQPPGQMKDEVIDVPIARQPSVARQPIHEAHDLPEQAAVEEERHDREPPGAQMAPPVEPLVHPTAGGQPEAKFESQNDVEPPAKKAKIIVHEKDKAIRAALSSENAASSTSDLAHNQSGPLSLSDVPVDDRDLDEDDEEGEDKKNLLESEFDKSYEQVAEDEEEFQLDDNEDDDEEDDADDEQAEDEEN
uniref:Uncharacterized protein n=1 Tax=Caenorhabditis japonica TaxID=281687 RepID=A0A8R1DL12_CAEJA